jgi:hypothetical protein
VFWLCLAPVVVAPVILVVALIGWIVQFLTSQ